MHNMADLHIMHMCNATIPVASIVLLIVTDEKKMIKRSLICHCVFEMCTHIYSVYIFYRLTILSCKIHFEVVQCLGVVSDMPTIRMANYMYTTLKC